MGEGVHACSPSEMTSSMYDTTTTRRRRLPREDSPARSGNSVEESRATARRLRVTGVLGMGTAGTKTCHNNIFVFIFEFYSLIRIQ